MLEKDIKKSHSRQLEFLPKLEKIKNQKKSRLWLAILLFLTTGASLIFALIKIVKEKKWPQMKLTLPNFSFGGAIMEEGEIRREHKEELKENLPNEELATAIKNVLKDKQGKWGVYSKSLKDDANIFVGVNSDQRFTAASLIKLPTILTFYKEVEAGKLDLNDKHLLKETEKSSGAGSLQYKPAGTEITLRNLAKLCFSQSDNTAFNILRNLIGDKKIQETIDDLGMKGTSFKENLTSPEDIGLFFEKLYRGELVKEEFKEIMIDDLTDTAFEDRISLAIPKETRVSHKIGNEIGVFNDAGIVFLDDKPFVLAILNDGVNLEEAKQVIPELSRQVYHFFETH